MVKLNVLFFNWAHSVVPESLSQKWKLQFGKKNSTLNYLIFYNILSKYPNNLLIIPLFWYLSTPCFCMFSKVLKVEIKKAIKHDITILVSINMSKFFIYFFNLRLKNINRPTIVGGHNPINTALSKSSSTK